MTFIKTSQSRLTNGLLRIHHERQNILNWACRFCGLLLICGVALGAHLERACAQEVTATSPEGPAGDAPILVPHNRGFTKTFFFWLGGVLCMYVVGRRVFREQAHERKTLRLFREELGHFFEEFDPVNITKWVEIATPHLYHSWREGDFSTMKSFTSERFISTQQAAMLALQDQLHIHHAYFDKVLSVHTLGATWRASEEEGRTAPPLGVELTLRVEVKAIDFVEDQSGNVISGQRKPKQYQQIWELVHNGKTWTLDEVYLTQDELTTLSNQAPLPPLASWRRPEKSE